MILLKKNEDYFRCFSKVDDLAHISIFQKHVTVLEKRDDSRLSLQHLISFSNTRSKIGTQIGIISQSSEVNSVSDQGFDTLMDNQFNSSKVFQ